MNKKMDGITILIIIIAVLYMAYLIYEKIYFNFIRKSFKCVIHINGIRGKSTTTRLIDAGLRGCGYKVFTKTTGTIPIYIDTNNQLHKVKRWGLANIREQLRMMKKAYKEKADILVLECMAVNPNLQYTSEHQMLKANINIITNVRYDHLNEMGDLLEMIAQSLSNTIPQNGYVIIGEDNFIDIFDKVAKKNNSQVIVAEKYLGSDLMNTFERNIACSLEVAKILGLDIEQYLNAMKNYHEDPGAFCTIKYQNTIFLNGFSINDPDSIYLVYQELIKKYDPNKMTILWTNRNDRGFRTIQHLNMLEKMTFKKIIVAGSSVNYAIRKLKMIPNIKLEQYTCKEDLLNEEIIFAIGNIVGVGMEILTFFKDRGEKDDL